MEPETIKALKQAANFIRGGDTKSARGILIPLLREDPDNGQAWFMLSYAVPRLDKQIYALQQTLRVDPTNEKAQRRLAKLGGEAPPTPASSQPKPQQAPAAPAKDSSDDLLSQRLFGEAAPPKKPSQEAATPPPVEASTSTAPFISPPAETPEEDSSEYPYDEVYDDGAPKERNTRQLRILMFGAVGIVILALLSIFVIRPIIVNFLNTPWVFNQAPPEGDVQGTLMSQAQLPTFTPVPATPTPRPSPTPVVVDLFNTQDLLPPSESSLGSMIQTGTQLQGLTGVTTEAVPNIFTVSESRLQNFAWDFAEMDYFDPDVNTAEAVFEMLGVANPGSDFISLFQNLWLDPNGTFYQPEKGFIAVAGYDFSVYQKYSFAQAYVQWLRNAQFSFTERGLYPPCVIPTDSCLAGLALVKGEAAFTARQWALQNLDESAQQEIENATRKYYIIPVLSPSTAMQAIRTFPYEQGYDFTEAVYNSGGWSTVNALYANPPQTTEQIMHPSKYLQGELGAEIAYTDLAEILPDEWQPNFQGTLGEWNTYLLLSAGTNSRARLDTPTAQGAAAGWNGDYAQFFTATNGSRAFTIHWKWDSADDAVVFANGLSTIAAVRVGGSQTEIAGTTCEQSSAETSCIVYDGQDVVWVLTQSGELAQNILEGYAFLTAE